MPTPMRAAAASVACLLLLTPDAALAACGLGVPSCDDIKVQPGQTFLNCNESMPCCNSGTPTTQARGCTGTRSCNVDGSCQCRSGGESCASNWGNECCSGICTNGVCPFLGSSCGNGVVDGTEQCDGGGCCNTNCTWKASGTECRAAAGVCDAAETCMGGSATCPTDSKKSGGTSCTDDGNACTVDQCNGTSNDCQHAAGNAGTACRSALGTCDMEETCNGSSTTCPSDAKKSATTECRPAAGVCDAAETCDGSGVDCPAESFKTSTTACRAIAGDCDVTDYCTGNTAACLADAFKSSTEQCRAAAGTCDIAEQCTGNSASCPQDVLHGSTVVCSAAEQWMPDQWAQNGKHHVTCAGNTASCGQPQNQPPVFDMNTIPQNENLQSGANYAHKIVATDPDGDALLYKATNLPDNLTLDEKTGQISGTVAQEKSKGFFAWIGSLLGQVLGGSTSVTFEAADGYGGIAVTAGGMKTMPPPSTSSSSAPASSSAPPSTTSSTPSSTPSSAQSSAKTSGGASVCGNGKRDEGEGCDDGNAVSGDGCSSACKQEPGFTCKPLSSYK